ncbi:threonine synthase [Pelagicoccus mobilis]|uniref:Threonine synthase n=1 Tax=Pelagicoccus mobilis TaxID=415221 RepID=A0A934RTT0_9BACT|nr:threonine synthase [Pelagicoccus mobilis]MBK1876298.1 threonine synthase [Pelagicoccus mobilis]
MKFVSTRGQTEPHSFSEAVKIGLAPDKGLFVPEKMPDLSEEIPTWEGLSYPEVCYEFFKHFATDIPGDELKALIEKAYSRFDHEEHAPLIKLSDKLYVQELFHGPTLAFKDFALQLLGCLYERQVANTGESINVLGATSGDTGAAAINGLLGKKGVNIFILYPDGRVSPLQERQMTCLEEDNVFPLCIEGSFDDAQAALKDVFGDKEFSEEVHLSAVNSINLARILAQCVYYIYAYLKLPAERRERATFVVPTGNFGNVLAGWMASRMGMIVDGFRVATNQNDILHRFFAEGDYSVGDVLPSHAPSMDIQVASNFERFLYFSLGGNAQMTREIMESFKKDGNFQVGGMAITEFMTSTRMDDAEIAEVISKVYREHDYVADPHTACGFKDLDHLETAIILSTAHPAKFPDVVEKCTGKEPTHESLEALKSKEIRKFSVAPDEASIKAFIRSKQ